MAKDSKERLLDAATKVFAAEGYESASTRKVVKEAGVNISAIPYYFGNKDGLYEAVIQRIISLVLKERGKIAADIKRELDQGDLSAERASQLLHHFLTSFADFLLSHKTTPYMAQIMMREQMQPSLVFNILYEGAMRPIHETLTRLVAHLTGHEAQSPEAILCTHTILGQISIFRTHKELIQRRSNWSEYGEAEKKAIIAMILTNADAILAAHRMGGIK